MIIFFIFFLFLYSHKAENENISYLKCFGCDLQAINFSNISATAVETILPLVYLNFIQHYEGLMLCPYYPSTNNDCTYNSSFSDSGVTIGYGLDLGSQTNVSLQKLGASSTLISQLTPFLGLKGQAAFETVLNYRKNEGKSLITISTEEANTLFQSMVDELLTQVESKYNSQINPLCLIFRKLPRAIRTVIIDICYEYGITGCTVTKQRFWRFLTIADYINLIIELEDSSDSSPTRRKAEAELVKMVYPNLWTPKCNGCGGENQPLDLGFILDGSGSIGSSNFYNSEMGFVKTILENLRIGQNQTRVSFVIYSTNVEYYYGFDYFSDYDSIIKEMTSWKYPGAGTDTGLALLFFVNHIYAANNGTGVRLSKDIPKIVILLTDGQSNYAVDDGVKAIRATEAKVFAVAVTNNVNYSELAYIASTPSEKYLLNVSDFLNLSNIVASLTDNVCDEPAELTSNSTKEYIEVNSTVSLRAMKYFKFIFINYNQSAHVKNQGFTISVKDISGGTYVYCSFTNQNPDYFNNDGKKEKTGKKNVVLRYKENQMRFLQTNTSNTTDGVNNGTNTSWYVYVAIQGVLSSESEFYVNVLPYANEGIFVLSYWHWKIAIFFGIGLLLISLNFL